MTGAAGEHNPAFREGLGFATGAYVVWGVAPLYFLLIEFVSPTEIIVQRVFWSLLVLLLLLALRQRLPELWQLAPRTYAWLVLSGVLLAVNWWTFVWALQNERVMETTVGYYINPIVTALLGVLVLKERMRLPQWCALGLAGLGVVNEVLNVGVFPTVALTLAFSFGFYGLVRKQLGMEPVAGLAVETLLMLPMAMLVAVSLASSGEMRAFDQGGRGFFFLALSGVITMVPLLCFNAAAIRLPLVVLGMFQYLAPSITLLLAVFFYGEPFTPQKAITFGCIWTALALLTVEGWYRSRVPYRSV